MRHTWCKRFSGWAFIKQTLLINFRGLHFYNTLSYDGVLQSNYNFGAVKFPLLHIKTVNLLLHGIRKRYVFGWISSTEKSLRNRPMEDPFLGIFHSVFFCRLHDLTCSWYNILIRHEGKCKRLSIEFLMNFSELNMTFSRIWTAC